MPRIDIKLRSVKIKNARAMKNVLAIIRNIFSLFMKLPPCKFINA